MNNITLEDQIIRLRSLVGVAFDTDKNMCEKLNKNFSMFFSIRSGGPIAIT